MATSEKYTLRQVSDLTGLSEFTLRGWENRYRAFTPVRTESGRRRYTKNELERAFVLRELIHRGVRIGDIANLSNNALSKKLADFDTPDSEPVYENDSKIEIVLKSVIRQDWDDFKKQFNQLVKNKKVSEVILNIILPMLVNVGRHVAHQRIGIAQEHIVSALIKEQLYRLLNAAPAVKKKLKNISVVITTPEGDQHEIGILIAHVLFSTLGVNSLYLGPNTPKNDLCETTLKFGATHILLASTVDRRAGAQEEIFSYVNYLDQHLPKSIEFWMGGRTFERSNLQLNRNLIILKTMQQLPEVITNLLKSNRGLK